jgi:NADH-quinone oxidoreductase subunit N
MECLIPHSFFLELFLIFTFLFQLLYNSYIVKNIKYHLPILNKELIIQTLYCLIILIIIGLISKFGIFFINFLFLNKEAIYLFKVFIVILSIVVSILIFRSNITHLINDVEYFSLIFLIILSSCLLVSAYDLISIYLVLEMQSLCFYAIASFKRNSAASVEAGLKYFILGSVASCFFLLGASILYGCFGTLNLMDLIYLFSFNLNNDLLYINSLVFIAVLIILFVFFFKISIFPFHWWSPDVYEGAPLSSTIIFVLLPKAIFFAFIIKWCFIVAHHFLLIKEICLYFGLLTIVFGSFFAIKQTRLKRFFLFSSITQFGFLILLLITNFFDGYVFIYFFLIIYFISSIIMWSVFNILLSSNNKIVTFLNISKIAIVIGSLKNLMLKNKYWAFIFFILFFSLAGIPPLGGFMAKFLIFLELLKNFNFFFTFFLIILSSFSVYYYIKLVKVIFFEPTLKISNSFCLVNNKSLSSIELWLISINVTALMLACIFPNIILFISNKLSLGLI